MDSGFTFCGVDIEDIGLHYIPELKNTYVYKPTNYKVSDQSFEGHAGGYYYGSTPSPKDITLRCYYEKSDIREEIMSKIFDYFKQGKTGKLSFAQRPWCWYIATVINVNADQLLNYENGIVTIQMRIYYPFARSTIKYIIDYDYSNPLHYNLICNSGVLTSADEVPTNVILSNTELTSDNVSPFLLYNPGTERATTAIEIAGDVGDGITITNATTKQSCKIVGLTKSITTNVDKWIVVDGLNGKTILTNNSSGQLAFLYHDSGFIDLEPSYPIIRDIEATVSTNSTSVSLYDSVSEDVVGKYIYINETWKRIVARPDETTITISSNAGISDTITTNIVLMNEIYVTANSTMALTKLNFIYYPTYA